MQTKFQKVMTVVALAEMSVLLLILWCNRNPASVATIRYAPGKTVTRIDTVIKYLPIISKIPASKITVTTNNTGSAAATTSQSDTNAGVSVPADTGVYYDTTKPHSYTFAQEYATGAKVAAEISSRFFPAKAPDDVSAILTYTPAPDTVKHTERIDSVFQTTEKKPSLPTWQALLVGGAIGIITTVAIAAYLIVK